MIDLHFYFFFSKIDVNASSFQKVKYEKVSPETKFVTDTHNGKKNWSSFSAILQPEKSAKNNYKILIKTILVVS